MITKQKPNKRKALPGVIFDKRNSEGRREKLRKVGESAIFSVSRVHAAVVWLSSQM